MTSVITFYIKLRNKAFLSLIHIIFKEHFQYDKEKLKIPYKNGKKQKLNKL